MTSLKIDQRNSDAMETTWELQPVNAAVELEIKAEGYDGGFHIQSPGASDKRVISKRSALQEFTCR